jgi:hypothetical protein
VKIPGTVLDPAIIRTVLVGKERELARLVDDLTRMGVSLTALRSLLACVPEASQSLSAELVEAISLLSAAETVVGSACGKTRNCSEALPSGPSPQFAAALSLSGSDGCGELARAGTQPGF